jgi:hypothetical protein
MVWYFVRLFSHVCNENTFWCAHFSYSYIGCVLFVGDALCCYQSCYVRGRGGVVNGFWFRSTSKIFFGKIFSRRLGSFVFLYSAYV